MRRDATVSVNSGLFAAKLGNLADDYDILADVRVEIGAGNAGGRCCLHFAAGSIVGD